MNLNILTINAYLSVPVPLRFNGPYERSARLMETLYSSIPNPSFIDFICFQELIVNREKVLKDCIYHPYHTSIDHGDLFGDNIRFLQSGLTIASKWPIVEQKNHVFKGKAYNAEAFMAKSVQYCKIQYDKKKCIHVFSTHMQAWSNSISQKIRLNQCQQILYFIQKQNVPSNEPVLLCGDFNFDFYEHAQTLSDVMLLLNFTMHLPLTPQFSFDPSMNQLTGGDDANEYKNRSQQNGCYESFIETGVCSCCPKALIDGIATSNDCLQPLTVKTCVIQNIATIPFEINISISKRRSTRNVSDHFAVYSQFEFPEIIPKIHYLAYEKVPINYAYWAWCVLQLILFLLLYIIFIVIIKRKKKKINSSKTNQHELINQNELIK